MYLIQRTGPLACIALLFVFASTAVAAGKVDAAQEALDRAEIANAIAGTIFAYDRHDAAAFAAYFTPDGEFRIDDKQRPVAFKGADIKKYFLGPPGPPLGKATGSRPPPAASGTSRHLITSSYIQMDTPTRARHWGYWTTVMDSGQPGVPVTVTKTGSYADELVKVNGRWLFSKHIVQFGHVELEQ